MKNKYHTRIAELEVSIAQLEKELQNSTEKAVNFHPIRVHSEKTTTQLDSSIRTLEAKIRKEQQGRRNTADVTRQFREAQKKLAELEKEFAMLESLEVLVKQHLNERFRRWVSFRKSIARRTSMLFNTYLAKKGFAGHIEFDHKEKTLDISVQLDKMRPPEESVSRDTKSLSGGERSYSTVALLLALWEAMETPFRAMDEFDVFMDAVNRRISMDLLIGAARSHKNRQFIFITPHDISTISPGPDLKIHRMYPPERGQTTLVEPVE